MGILAVIIVEAFVLRRLKARAGETPTTADDFLIDRIHGRGPLAYLGIVEAALRF